MEKTLSPYDGKVLSNTDARLPLISLAICWRGPTSSTQVGFSIQRGRDRGPAGPSDCARVQPLTAPAGRTGTASRSCRVGARRRTGSQVRSTTSPSAPGYASKTVASTLSRAFPRSGASTRSQHDAPTGWWIDNIFDVIWDDDSDNFPGRLKSCDDRCSRDCEPGFGNFARAQPVFSADDELLSDVFVAQGEYNKCRALFLLLRLECCHGRLV